MARKPMVTRTIITTKVNAMCVNLETAEVFNKEVTLPRTYKDEKKLLKAVENVVNSDKERAVQIVDSSEVETLYGMTEQSFIDSATVLDPKTRKELEQSTADDDEE